MSDPIKPKGTVRIVTDNERVVNKWDLWLMRTIVALGLLVGLCRVLAWVIG